MSEDFVNTQIRDAVQFANHSVMGNAPAQSVSMLDALMAETVGMAMYNAVNTQHNAQMVGNAAVAASCARMLKVQGIPWFPPAPVSVPPVVTGVAPVQGAANTYKVAGMGFAAGLTVELSQNGAPLESISRVTSLTPIAFVFQCSQLASGFYLIEVVNADGTRSAPYPFNVSTTQLITTD